MGDPAYAWSGHPSLTPTDTANTSITIGTNDAGSVTVFVIVTWPIYNADGAQCGVASANTNLAVNIISGVTVSFSPGMIGLDRTDAGPTNITGDAAATLACGHESASLFTWGRSTSACEISKDQPHEGTGLTSVTYQTKDKESCSAADRDQVITVAASPGGNATTNFTVVKVDVTIDDVKEDTEETEGAFVAYAEDTNGVWTVQGTNALAVVSIQCFPEDLPDGETITISAPSKFLYELIDDQYVEAQTSYKAREINTNRFYLHGHAVSGGLKDKESVIEHNGSGAKGRAKFTVIQVVCIEPEPDTYLENYYVGSPLNSPTNRIYTIPVSPATVGNGTDDPNFIWSLGLKIIATIQQKER